MMAQQGVGNQRTRRLVLGAVVMGLALTLGGCTGAGGGRLADPLPGAPAGTAYGGNATFAFTFTCELKGGKAVIRGQLRYSDTAPSTVGGVAFPPVGLHGSADPVFTEYATCEQAAAAYPSTVQFQGTYRPDRRALAPGQFTVLAFDQGKRDLSSSDTGDSFSIELFGGAYDGYTRGGYIKGGNIHVTP